MRTLFDKTIRLGLLGLMSITVVACGGSGNLSIGLTDAPRDDFTDVTVNLKEVQLVGDGDIVSVMAFADGEKVYNLLDLQNTIAALGAAEVPAGKYFQIRLIVHESGNSATPNAGAATPMTIASGTVTGAKLVVPAGFEVRADQNNEIVLDWDLEAENATTIELQPDGTYLMTPVLKMQSQNSSE